MSWWLQSRCHAPQDSTLCIPMRSSASLYGDTCAGM
jgi:hypothetical protein